MDSRRSLQTHAILLACLLSAGSMCAGQLMPAKPESNPNVSFYAKRESTLQAIVELSSKYKVPIGIILGVKSSLCEEQHSIKIDDRSFQDAMLYLVEGTGYKVLRNEDATVLRAPDISEYEDSLLNHRFPRFAATNMTVTGAGGWLAGYIMTTKEGSGGFATDELSSPEAKTFSVSMSNATPVEIASRIVSLGSKGIWFFRPTINSTPQTDRDLPLEIFGYEDNAEDLVRNTCAGFTKYDP